MIVVVRITMKLDQRQTNMAKALVGAAISLCLVSGFYLFLVTPILDQDRKKYLEKCYDFIEEDGEWVQKDNMTCTVPHYPVFSIGLGVIPFFVFIAIFNYLEQKRVHNWRSYR